MSRPTHRIRNTAISFFLILPVASASADDKDVIAKARSAYYNLGSHGLVEFQCSITPNWDALLQETKKTNPAGVNRALDQLRQLRFSVSVGSDGPAKITHNTVAGIDSDALKQIYGGVEEMVPGFFATWNGFMMSYPLPDPGSSYQLQDQQSQWRISYKEEDADIVTVMGKDFAIRELDVKSPKFVSRIQPSFMRTGEGFLLAAYRADYRDESPDDTTQLQARIGYQTVNGLQLPKQLNVDGSYGKSPFQVEVAFSGCKATKR